MQSVKVVVRIRPEFRQEADLGLGLCVGPGLDSNTVELSTNFDEGDDAQSIYSFRFARVFDEDTPQEEIHKTVSSPLVASVLDGYNACILAYGQTGSGKTHTMLGEHFSDLGGDFDLTTQQFKPKRAAAQTHDFSSLRSSDGLIPRMLHEIFAAINTNPDPSRLLVRASFIEIYNEHVRDLLLPQPLKADQSLRLREAACGLWVTGATEVLVESMVQVMELLHRGGKNRTTAATLSNAVSSRSHAIFVVGVIRQVEDAEYRRSQLYLVDLAGSEKLAKTGAEDDRLTEAKSINQSLLALGKVALISSAGTVS